MRALLAFLIPCSALATPAQELNRGEKNRSDAPLEELSLGIGQQRVISAEGVRSYSEGSRGIVDVRLTKDGRQFVLVGLKPGKTSVLFLLLDGRERHLLLHVEGPDGEKLEVGEGRIERRENIRLDFYFVQLDRSEQSQLGMRAPPSLSLGSMNAQFDFLSQSFQSASAVVEDQALFRLDLAQTTGFAKLMRQAAVMTENGRQATFSGGGEVNIPVQGSLSTGIHRIAFGSSIQMLPKYDRDTNRLEIELSAEVSDLTDDRGSGAPGRTTSTIHTVVNLELGQAVVLAGLSSASEMRSQGGVFGLSQIPVLGLFFGSRSVHTQSSDNVIFIVPTVLDTPRSDAREKIRSALNAYVKDTGREETRKQIHHIVHPEPLR